MSPYAPDPDHWFYLYLDEGSSFITVRDNWCPAEKFLKNANGPGNLWKNNGPMVFDKIKGAAGLETSFRDLLSENENWNPCETTCSLSLTHSRRTSGWGASLRARRGPRWDGGGQRTARPTMDRRFRGVFFCRKFAMKHDV
jgi:hypothetical protein